MKKIYLFVTLLLAAAGSFAQSTAWLAPDSAFNVAKPGAGPNPAWNITNPMVHTGSGFSTTPVSSGYINNVSDYLYFRDFGISVPTGATITGVEVIASRGGCNSGSYYRDTISLAHNGAAIGNYVEDSTNGSTAIDTLGAPNNTWGTLLTPAIVNDPQFGVFFSFQSFGICTFGVFDCRVKVHYQLTTGITGLAESRSLRVYPNPASSAIVVISAPGNYTITDQVGREALRGTVTGNEASIDLSPLAPGLYLLRSGSEVVKFVKE